MQSLPLWSSRPIGQTNLGAKAISYGVGPLKASQRPLCFICFYVSFPQVLTRTPLVSFAILSHCFFPLL